MRFTPALLDRYVTDDDERLTLARMTAGGTAGGSGYRYETLYAQFRLVELLAAYLAETDLERLAHVYFGMSGPGDVSVQGCSYVDDVVRSVKGRFTYSQLKTSEEDTWTGRGGKLAGDFRKQHTLCAAAGMTNFTLELVTPHPHRAELLAAKLPALLRDFTEVIFFPQEESLSRILLDPSHPLQPHLEALGAYEPQSLSTKRELLYGVVLAWEAEGERNTPRRVLDVLMFLHRQEGLPLKKPDLTLDALTREVIESVSIPGLDVSVENGFARYRYGLWEGTIARIDTSAFQRFVRRLRDTPPNTLEDFRRLLP